MSSFYQWDGDVLILNIRGTAGAKRDVIDKVIGDQLKVSVKAAPEAGKATKYMVRFLAGEFGVSSRDIEVVFGATNVKKQFRIKAPTRLPSVIERDGG